MRAGDSDAGHDNIIHLAANGVEERGTGNVLAVLIFSYRRRVVNVR